MNINPMADFGNLLRLYLFRTQVSMILLDFSFQLSNLFFHRDSVAWLISFKCPANRN